MLNLKGVRFRVYGDDTQTLRVTSPARASKQPKDIETNADVKLLTPTNVCNH